MQRGASVLGGNAVGAEYGAVSTGQLAAFGDGEAITIDASPSHDPRTATLGPRMLGGQPSREPAAWSGPFVMNRQAELPQAFDDDRTGKLGTVPVAAHAPTDDVAERIDAGPD